MSVLHNFSFIELFGLIEIFILDDHDTTINVSATKLVRLRDEFGLSVASLTETASFRDFEHSTRSHPDVSNA